MCMPSVTFADISILSQVVHCDQKNTEITHMMAGQTLCMLGEGVHIISGKNGLI